jgi:metal-sulfur cluster biosynthetic enzyme
MSTAEPPRTADLAALAEDQPEVRERYDAVQAALAGVWDPELALDVVSMGLVYDLRVDAERVEIDMTLTTPGCPVSEQLPAEVLAAVQAAVPDVEVVVNLVWEPPWTPDRLSPAALHQLGFDR